MSFIEYQERKYFKIMAHHSSTLTQLITSSSSEKNYKKSLLFQPKRPFLRASAVNKVEGGKNCDEILEKA